MLYAALKTLHLLAVVLWVGGMAFMLLFLRPALPLLAPPERLKLLREVMRRFFAGVTAAVVVVLVSGAWMFDRAARAGGAAFAWPADWIAMAAVGVAMAIIFAVIRLSWYPRFAAALDRGEMPAAAALHARIRAWVAVNLVLGVAVVVIAVLF